MTSVDSNFNFLCGRPHGAGPGPPVHMRPPEPDPPPCGRHKWMAPYMLPKCLLVKCTMVVHIININYLWKQGIVFVLTAIMQSPTLRRPSAAAEPSSDIVLMVITLWSRSSTPPLIWKPRPAIATKSKVNSSISKQTVNVFILFDKSCNTSR